MAPCFNANSALLFSAIRKMICGKTIILQIFLGKYSLCSGYSLCLIGILLVFLYLSFNILWHLSTIFLKQIYVLNELGVFCTEMDKSNF